MKVQLPKDRISTVGQDVSLKDLERNHILKGRGKK